MIFESFNYKPNAEVRIISESKHTGGANKWRGELNFTAVFISALEGQPQVPAVLSLGSSCRYPVRGKRHTVLIYSHYDTGAMVRGSIPGYLFIIQNVQTHSGVHPVSYSMGTGVPSPAERPPGSDVDLSPPSSAEVKNEWSNKL